MRSTRAWATGVAGLPTSNTSQSPAQKSKWRKGGAAQGAVGVGSAARMGLHGRLPPAKRTTAEIMPTCNQWAIGLMATFSLSRTEQHRALANVKSNGVTFSRPARSPRADHNRDCGLDR